MSTPPRPATRVATQGRVVAVQSPTKGAITPLVPVKLPEAPSALKAAVAPKASATLMLPSLAQRSKPDVAALVRRSARLTRRYDSDHTITPNYWDPEGTRVGPSGPCRPPQGGCGCKPKPPPPACDSCCPEPPACDSCCPDPPPCDS